MARDSFKDKMAGGNQEKNRYHISNLKKTIFAKDDIQETMTEAQKRRTVFIWQLITFFIVSYVLLQFYDSGRSLFEGLYYERTYNPFVVLYKSLREKPFAALIIIAVSYVAARIVGGMKKADISSPDKKVVLDERGFEIIRGFVPLHLNRGVLERIFNLSDPKIPEGAPIGIDEKTGSAICLWDRDAKIDYNDKLSNPNTLSSGASGTGKTSGTNMPMLSYHITSGHGALVTDPKAELFRLATPLCIASGQKSWILNAQPGELKNSDGWDCLKHIREVDDNTAVQYATAFADIILRNSKEDFWTESNQNFLILLIMYVCKADGFEPLMKENYLPGEKDKYRTWREVAELFYLTTDEFIQKVGSCIEGSMHDRNLLGLYYRNWQKNKAANDVSSGLGTKLSTLLSEDMRELLSSDEIDIEELAKGNAVVFVCTPGLDNPFRELTTLFVSSVFTKLFAIAKRHAEPHLDTTFFILLEELANFGKIEMLAELLGQCRSYNIVAHLSVQTLTQLDMYDAGEKKDKADILTNCAVHMLTGANILGTYSGSDQTVPHFAERSGEMTIREYMTAEHRTKLLPDWWQRVFQLDQRQTVKEQRRLVYEPSDIQHMKPSQIYIAPAGRGALITEKYQWSRHILYGTYAVDRETNTVENFVTGQHIPVRNGGKPLTEENYRIEFGQNFKSARKSMKSTPKKSAEKTWTSEEDRFLVR